MPAIVVDVVVVDGEVVGVVVRVKPVADVVVNLEFGQERKQTTQGILVVVIGRERGDT